MFICISSPTPTPAINRITLRIMKPLMIGCRLVVVGLCLAWPAARAYPPAPDVLIYGIVKDEYGNPLANTSDMVILQTPSGVQVAAPIQPNLAIGVNFAINVPM